MGSYYEPITMDVYSISGFTVHGGRPAGRLHAAANAHDLATVHDFTTGAAHHVAAGAVQDSHAGCLAGCLADRHAGPHPAYTSQGD